MKSSSSPGTGPKKTRVAVFNTHPIQYYAPIWRKLGAFSDLDLKVYYGSDFSIRGYRDREFQTEVLWDVPLLDGYDSRFLTGSEKVDEVGFFRPSPLPAMGALLAERPDVVVMTAYHAAFWYGIAAAAAAVGTRVVMRHDATDEAFGSRGIKGAIRGIILRSLYRSVSRFAVVGCRARRHLKRFGVEESRMAWSPFCVDSDRVESRRGSWMEQRTGLRKELGIQDHDIALLFCGKLIAQKDPLLIFEAIRRLPNTSSLHLVVAGSGPLQGEVEEAGRAVLGERFHPLGFLNQGELGRAYATADALVLPSRSETWGLVVNEALQFGLPVILADGVGCHEDLVPDRQTGWVFPAGDAEGLAQALSSLLEELPGGRARYWEAGRACAVRYSLDSAASGLREAILSACQ